LPKKIHSISKEHRIEREAERKKNERKNRYSSKLNNDNKIPKQNILKRNFISDSVE
jgi:hypothetical protein